MKAVLKTALLLAALIIGVLAVALYPKLSNMKSEYATASIIRELEDYVIKNGHWPISPDAFPSPPPQEVFINYRVNLEDLLKNTALLEQSVRPQSAKFYTYPHYKSDLQRLLKVIEEVKRRAEAGFGSHEGLK